MRNVIAAVLLVVLVASFISSCTTISHGSATCPSHDPNYFRKGK